MATVEESLREQERIDHLAARLEAVEGRLEILEKPGAIIVPITTFEPEPFDPLREIKAVVEQVDDDEYLATFFDAGVCASGSNPVEAIESLKELLLSRFDYLSSLPTERLGPIPAHQIAVLRTFIRRRG